VNGRGLGAKGRRKERRAGGEGWRVVCGVRVHREHRSKPRPGPSGRSSNVTASTTRVGRSCPPPSLPPSPSLPLSLSPSLPPSAHTLPFLFSCRPSANNPSSLHLCLHPMSVPAPPSMSVSILHLVNLPCIPPSPPPFSLLPPLTPPPNLPPSHLSLPPSSPTHPPTITLSTIPPSLHPPPPPPGVSTRWPGGRCPAAPPSACARRIRVRPGMGAMKTAKTETGMGAMKAAKTEARTDSARRIRVTEGRTVTPSPSVCSRPETRSHRL
jgi:hypothetical protein